MLELYSPPPLPYAGSFKLSWGAIRPFPRGAEPRFMLVSDIDGTMIGEHGDPSQYASSRRFRCARVLVCFGTYAVPHYRSISED